MYLKQMELNPSRTALCNSKEALPCATALVFSLWDRRRPPRHSTITSLHCCNITNPPAAARSPTTSAIRRTFSRATPPVTVSLCVVLSQALPPRPYEHPLRASPAVSLPGRVCNALQHVARSG